MVLGKGSGSSLCSFFKYSSAIYRRSNALLEGPFYVKALNG